MGSDTVGGDGLEPVDVFASGEHCMLDELFGGDIEIYADTLILESEQSKYTIEATDSEILRIDREDKNE